MGELLRVTDLIKYFPVEQGIISSRLSRKVHAIDGVSFSVHNPGHIDPAIQAQIFQRYFTTKGEGRGLGTYGMKLLAEEYLGGRVSFASSRARGTTFSVWVPGRGL